MSFSTHRAVYRLAARPYALSNAFGGAGRKQFATIHHTAASVKTVVLRHVFVGLESGSDNSIIVADLVRLTTAPATGNPGALLSKLNPVNPAIESVGLSLPTTAGTESGIISTMEWDLRKGGAASYPQPPPSLQFKDLIVVSDIARDPESESPTLRAGVLEGYAVTFDVSIANTVKAFVIIEFTET